MRKQILLFKENKINKNELAKKVAEQNYLTVKAATAVVDSVLNTIMDTVAAGE